MKFLASINRIIENISSILLGIMTVLVILQVFFRYVLSSPLSSSEELARFSMVWLIMIGATTVLRNKGHVAVTFIVDLCPNIIKKGTRIFSYVCTLIFLLILVIYGYEISVSAMKQIAPASKIPLGWIMLSIPTFGFIGSLYTLEHIFNEFKNDNKIVEEDA